MSYEYSRLLINVIPQYRYYCEASNCWTKNVENNIRYFDQYCSTNYPDKNCLTQEMVDAWCAKKENETNNSCRARIYPIIGLIDYIKARGLADVNLPDIPKYCKCTYIPCALSKEILKAFFKECDSIQIKKNGPEGKHRRMTIPVLFRLLYSSGIRVYEVRMLKKSDVNLSTGVVSIVQTKKGIQHYIVLHDTMLEILQKYDAAISLLYPNREYFFPGTRKNPYLSNKWLSQNFKQIWDKVCDKSSVAYDFRHNYAVENINSWEGDDPEIFDRLVYLSKSMGHTHLNSTRYYYHFTPRLAQILSEKTEEGLNEMLPEVDYEDFED